MKMTRNQHWTEAQRLLGLVDNNPGAKRPRLSPADQERLTLAQVHATLAAAPHEVVGEGYGPERRVLKGPDPDVVVDRLLAALAELGQDPGWAEPVAFIRERVLGEGR